MRKSEVIIKSIDQVAERTCKIILQRPSDFDFLPGQYIQVTLQELKYSDHRGPTREFSICSSPHDRDELSVVFRNTDSGFKKTIIELDPGSSVLIEGPFGLLTLPRKGRHVFVAGGIGIAPFYGMIVTALEENLGIDMRLLYANKNKQSATFLRELEKLSSESEQFSLNSVYGKLEEGTISKTLGEEPGADWWIVGSPRMVADVKAKLELHGISGAKIHTEDFVGY